MDDLKSVTVSHLRELAQKHLGSGYSKLKKEELIAALAAHIPALAKLARLAGITVARKSSTDKRVAAKEPKTERPKPAASKSPGRSAASKPKKESKAPARDVKSASAPKTAGAKVSSKAKPAQQEEKQGRVSAPKRVAAKRASEKPGAAPPARPAQVVTFPPKPRGPRVPGDSAASTPEASAAVEAGTSAGSASASAPTPETPAAAQPPAPPPPPVQHDAEPVVEGFFVARVMGEEEARRHHMTRQPATPEGPPEYDEGLGDLPGEYQDDSTLLLPRDPHTLFVSWDFSAAARTRALQGLDSPRAVLRVFDGEKMVRELDCVLETRGYYIHDLPPGRPYRVEAHFVGRDGRNRRIGPSSNRVALPPSGTSTDTSIRFLRVPTRVPEPQPLPEMVPPVRTRTPEFEEREYLTWRRVNLPGSAGVQDIPESRRERTGASAQPEAHLEGPPRAPGASDQRYMEARERALGASDMRYLEAAERAPGASEQRYLEAPERAPGASEQRYLGGEQSRERQYLDVGRAPGASDMRYLESPGRAPGASDMRYQEGASQPAGGARSPHQYLDIGRAPGASDMRYLESPPRAPGASDQRYLDSPPRAPGASDSRDKEAAPSSQGSSEAPLPRKPPSGSGRS